MDTHRIVTNIQIWGCLVIVNLTDSLLKMVIFLILAFILMLTLIKHDKH